MPRWSALERQVPVGGRLDAVAFGGQAIGEREHEAGFVFDEQDAGGHGRSGTARVPNSEWPVWSLRNARSTRGAPARAQKTGKQKTDFA